MFTEKMIKEAFQAICELYNDEDCWMLDEDFFVVEGIPDKCMEKALKDRMEDVFAYKALSDSEIYLDYRGAYLFDQQAVRILRYENYSVADDHYGMEYDAELWLLEDMSFVIVNCFRTMIENQENLGALTEYRIVKKKIESCEDLFFPIEDLLEELDCICSLTESYKR